MKSIDELELHYRASSYRYLRLLTGVYSNKLLLIGVKPQENTRIVYNNNFFKAVFFTNRRARYQVLNVLFPFKPFSFIFNDVFLFSRFFYGPVRTILLSLPIKSMPFLFLKYKNFLINKKRLVTINNNAHTNIINIAFKHTITEIFYLPSVSVLHVFHRALGTICKVLCQV